MGLPRFHTEYESWSITGVPVRIEYPAAVLEEICAAAVEGLSRFRHGGIEVGGVLYGVRRNDAVRVLDFAALDCEYAFGPRFVLSDRDRARMHELLRAPARNPKLRGLEVVGWYHSHTRSGLSLSPRDLEIYERFFPQPWQVALIVRPDAEGPGVAGFFLREASHRSLFEVEVQPRSHRSLEQVEEPVAAQPSERSESVAARPAPATVRPDPTPPATAARIEASPAGTEAPPAEPELVLHTAPAPPDLPSWARARSPHARTWRWALPALLLAASAMFGVARYWQNTAPPPALSLWVADVGGQLLIEWDRAARPIQSATTGSLQILDGSERVEIQMDPDHLKEGSVDYVRRAEVVDVRLRIRGAGGEATEMIRFVGPPVARPASDEVTRERDALRAEVARLQGEVDRLTKGRRQPATPKP